MTTRAARPASVLLALVTLLAACSDADPLDESRPDPVADAAGQTPAATADDDGTTPDDPAGPVTGEAGAEDSLSDQWEAARQEVVDTIVEAGYGVGDDNILRGPAGFEIDLGACPDGWSDTAGLDGTTISIGHTTTQSGTLFNLGELTAGLQAYIDQVNAAGGVGGRTIELTIHDDGYQAETTVQLVDEMVDGGDQPFALTTLGAPTTLRVYDTINQHCIPHPFVIANHPALGDPVNHPFTTGLQMSYATEAALWGEWIKRHRADDLPVTVSALVMGNSFGAIYQEAFSTWMEANPGVVAELQVEQHVPAVATVADEMGAIAAAEPDVFIAMTAGSPCLLAVKEADRLGLADITRFVPSICGDAATYLVPAGAAADGWYLVGGGLKATNDPTHADDPYVGWVNAELAAQGLDPAVGLHGTGFGLYGWALVEALRIADALPGGLTRTNLVLAVRAMDLVHPLALDGVSFAVDGNDDAFFIEGTDYSRFDAAAGTWAQLEVVDANGLTPTCPWDGASCTPTP